MRDRIITPREAAEVLGLSVATIYTREWRRRHGLVSVKIGSSLRFRERDLADFIKRCREAAPAAVGAQ